ncbi:NAD(P)H-hydrate dehydratase, partial [Xanthomonas sp. Kuri4-1]
GVRVHASAGRRLAASVGTLGFLAREIPGQVPGILDRLG